MNLSVVLPCYNEQENIEKVVADVDAWMKRDGHTGAIIAVDDGSSDGTLQLLQSLKATYPALKVVKHEVNGGYGLAVRSGCDAAETEWIAFMDSDGQFKAEELAILIAHADKYPFVTGRRIKRADPLIRNIFGKLLGIMNWLVLGLWVRDVNCGLKMFRRDVWPEIRPVHGIEKLFNTEMFLQLKRKNIPWVMVDVPHYPRMAGTPTGGSWRVIVRMFKELLALRSAFKKEDGVATVAVA